MGKTCIAVAALLSIALAPAVAWAHAILVQSSPAASASVAAGRIDMTFRYNSRIDRERSRLTLTDPAHKEVVLKILPSGPPDTLQTSAELTTPGTYVLRWQVLAVDGHITRGDVPFTVTEH